jgi:hypothetical protein
MKAPEKEIPEVYDLPDWMLLSRREASKYIGVSAATLSLMVKAGLVPAGVPIMARKQVWTAGQVKNIAKRMIAGEFSGVQLWAKEMQS